QSREERHERALDGVLPERRSVHADEGEQSVARFVGVAGRRERDKPPLRLFRRTFARCVGGCGGRAAESDGGCEWLPGGRARIGGTHHHRGGRDGFRNSVARSEPTERQETDEHTEGRPSTW